MDMDTMRQVVIARFGADTLGLARGFNDQHRGGQYQSYSAVPHLYARAGVYYQWSKSDLGSVLSGLTTIG